MDSDNQRLRNVLGDLIADGYVDVRQIPVTRRYDALSALWCALYDETNQHEPITEGGDLSKLVYATQNLMRQVNTDFDARDVTPVLSALVASVATNLNQPLQDAIDNALAGNGIRVAGGKLLDVPIEVEA